MAISWDTKISNVDVASKRADVSFTRTDPEKPDDTFSVRYSQTPSIETPAQRTELFNTVWAAWQKEKVRRASVSALVVNLEQAANDNLNKREA